MPFSAVKTSMETDAPLHACGRTLKTSEFIADRLRRRIVTGDLKDGDCLPPTSALLETFSVSRPVLREAFRILENENLIEVTRGSKSVRVRKPSVEGAARFAAFTLQATGATIGDLYQARLAFEPFAARLIAERCDPRDIAQLRRHLAEQEAWAADRNWPELAASLARFHHLLVDLTGNRMLALTAAVIAQVLEQHQRNARANDGKPGALPALTPQARKQGPRSIAKLIRLIEAREGAGAESHWRAHLVGANAFWLSSQDQHAVIHAFG